MLQSVAQGNWSLSHDWVFHHHIDQTCTAYNPYSGTVLAFNEISGWVLQRLASSSQSTQELEVALSEDVAGQAEMEVSSLLEATLNSLHEDARVIILSAHS